MNSMLRSGTVLAITFSLLNVICQRRSLTTTKNILHWLSSKDIWIRDDFFGKGNEIFVANKCAYTNCYMNRRQEGETQNSSLAFDAILINGEYLESIGYHNMPHHRGPDQIFIFLNMESPWRLRPICSSGFDDFFNWTITYRLDSDIPWPYFKVKTVEDHRSIGPGERVPWISWNNMKNITKGLAEMVMRKTKIAAWFVSKCRSKSNREDYIDELNVELLRLTRRHVDIYGHCGQKKCSRNISNSCDTLLKRHYFFYMAMENSFDKDYVTEKFLRGMRNGAVPIVFGGANYTRFAPPYSYIDARRHTPKKLAAKMLHLIRNRKRYQNYLRWRNHYYYTDNINVANIACQLCAKLNEDKTTKRYKEFRRWWTGDNYEEICAS